MRITKLGTDIVSVNENNYGDYEFQKIKRIHLLKLDFVKPEKDIINMIMYLFPKTNRFVIENNIREYNSVLRGTEKKYYVMNKKNANMVSFLRKNNKILFNFVNLNHEEKNFFLLDNIFEDLLKNVEVIAMSKKIHDLKMETLNKWNGNIIVLGDNEVL
jgi:hypothetical protein